MISSNQKRVKKAYSYFGTIVKNYLLGQLIKDNKKVRTQVSYEDYASDLEERPDMLVYQKEDHLEKEGKLQKLMAEIIGEISEELNNEKLTENERSVGESLVYMFEIGKLFLVTQVVITSLIRT